jgi:hypothetical protein
MAGLMTGAGYSCMAAIWLYLEIVTC